MRKKMRVLESALGLLIVAGLFSLFRSSFGPAQALESKLYDWRLRFCESQETSPRIVLVAVDEASLAKIGSWPWSRSRWADLLRAVSAAKPAAIGLGLDLSKPADAAPLSEIKELEQAYARLRKLRGVIDRRGRLARLFSKAAERLDADQDLAQAIRESGRVVLAARPARAETASSTAPPAALPWAMPRAGSTESLARVPALALPLPVFAQAAAGVGVAAVERDPDGVVRRQAPVLAVDGQVVPSFPLALASLSMGASPGRLTVVPGRRVAGNGIDVPLSASGTVLIDFYGPSRTYLPYPAWEALSGKIPASAFYDKIVLIGPTARESAPSYKTAVDRAMTGLELAANELQNILDRNFILPAPRGERWEGGLWGFAAFFAAILLPFMGATWAVAVAWLFSCALVGVGVYFMTQGFWLVVAGPASAIFLSALVVAFTRVAWFAFLGRRGLKREKESPAVAGARAALPAPGAGETAAAAPKTLNGGSSSKPAGDSIPYEILREIDGFVLGQGQSAAAGKDPRHGGEVLVISRRFSSLDDATAFLAEGPVLVSFEHPNFLHVLDFGEAGRTGYLAAEMPAGPTLAARLRSGPPLSVEAALGLMADLCGALEAASKAGIPVGAVHPASIALGRDGAPKLLNYWGGGLPAAASAGAAGGEPKKDDIAYLSPEAVAGKPLGIASAVFSSGVLLYELLTGKHPFLRPEDGLGELVFKIVNDPLMPLSELNPAAPRCAQEIVMRAMAKAPGERYAGPGEMAASLRSCLASMIEPAASAPAAKVAGAGPA